MTDRRQWGGVEIVCPSLFRAVVQSTLASVLIVVGATLVFGLSLIMLIISGVVIAIGLLFQVVNFVMVTPRIELDENGFRLIRIFDVVSRQWSDVEGSFETIPMGFIKATGYRLTDDFKSRTGFRSRGVFPGFDDGVSGWFVMNAESVTALLNDRKKESTSSSAGDQA